ncbi:MAG: endonuclease [Prevotella sp.]|nr:endonuclease [Prevotella sp.]
MIAWLLAGLFTFVELNCENLFDCINDSLKNDEEFLSDGSYSWTRTRYWQKLNRVGQTIVACGGEGSTQALPDLVALCEVESDTCLFDLTRRSLLRSARYEYVMTHSPDLRGVNVALLWSPFTFRLLSYTSLRVDPVKNLPPTRDVLYVSGKTKAGDTLHVFVVHAPSRLGGGNAETYRKRVSLRICAAIDSIRQIQPTAHILVAGDFNAYSKEKSIKLLQNTANLTDISEGACGKNGAKATYRYRGEWRSLDHILISASLQPLLHKCFINDAPFLMEDDEKYGGKRPFRTYLGPRYMGGFSDHLPLVAQFEW